MNNDIKQSIESCPQCQISTGGQRTTETSHPLVPVPAFHRRSLDFIGPLPVTSTGNRWILAAIDHTTKCPIVKASSSAPHEFVAKFVYEEIVLSFGCPTKIITDRGTNFTIVTLNSYFKLIGIKHLLTSAYHPRTNGVVERFNRLFAGMLAKYIADDAVNKWDLYINRALFACRIRQHHATGKLIPILNNDDSNDFLHRNEQINQIFQDREKVHQHLKSNTITMKNYYDQHLKPSAHRLKQGDWVLFRHINGKKFQPRWTGPYKIIHIGTLGTYQLKDVQGRIKSDLVQRDMLKIELTSATPVKSWYKPSSRLYEN
ncbi:unnamed protein product [Adineta ricciae]|uniref:Integrase catalytic domain-containing protein n=1 Tax=Adineta ricciae TaxID=249248 RepID=A0A815W9C2_ADIRI|nr:unnamed protein product [Adineta ricciae]CAF1630771.1 unnamed protein product [Adineta ricciae]